MADKMVMVGENGPCFEAPAVIGSETEKSVLEKQIAQALDRKKDYPGAANLVRKLMFLDKLDEEIDLAYEEVD